MKKGFTQHHKNGGVLPRTIFRRKSGAGFTLIELLVVMAIIGILAALTLTGFNAAQKTSRDGRRQADMQQIRAALEMYRADNGVYPATVSCPGSDSWERSYCGSVNNNFLNSLRPGGYMPEVPKDPLNSSNQQAYVYQRSATYGYRLMYNPEAVADNADPDPNDCYGNRWLCFRAP